MKIHSIHASVTVADRQTRENVLSLCKLPRSVLPFGPARDALLIRASKGQDVYAYAPLQRETRPEHMRYNVWVHGTRYTVAEWLEAYRDA